MKDAQIGIIIDGTTLTDYAGDLLPSKDRVRYRRNKVVKLLLNGFSQRSISSTLHCSLSTIEKDIKSLRENVSQRHYFLPLMNNNKKKWVRIWNKIITKYQLC